MAHWRRALSAALACLCAALLLPAPRAAEADGTIGSLRLDADESIVSRKTLELELFQEAPVRGFRFNRNLQLLPFYRSIEREGVRISA